MRKLWLTLMLMGFGTVSFGAVHIRPAGDGDGSQGGSGNVGSAPITAAPSPVSSRGGGGGIHNAGAGHHQGVHGAHSYGTRPMNANPVGATVTHTRIVRQPVRSVPVPQSHSTVANTHVVHAIQQERRVEIVPNHNYWHATPGGVRYVHTYRGGVHWYGFYHGSDFYWTRYHRNHWWWYDPTFNHWVFWANGYWWWSGPAGVLYVYQNDSYYPYDEAPVYVAAPAPVEKPVNAETDNNGGVWTSADGQRMIQIQGPQSEAFLYDKSGTQPRYLAYLGSQVDRVRFSGGRDGRPLKILVDFKNGEFSLFSSDGEPLDVTPPDVPTDGSGNGANIPSTPPSPPTDIPN